ncbi:MAG: hypothetical protein K2X77_33135 [Candidatus Obscuribacterales bacterium]|nr:hypothetical protein [Candidatus Obscuribacterales bacterium]
MYFNEVGSVLRDIDALGNETSFERGGLDRVTKVTLPEENSTETSYDENNNVLTTTQVAKPGSGLSDIVRSAKEDINEIVRLHTQAAGHPEFGSNRNCK